MVTTFISFIMLVVLLMVLKLIILWLRKNFFVVFACDKFRSYIIDSKVKVHTDHQGLKEIIERKDVKPRFIRWLLLLQEFELQITERRHEELEEEPQVVEVKKVTPKIKTMKICIPLGTILKEQRIPCCIKTTQGKSKKGVTTLVKEKLPTTSHKVEAQFTLLDPLLQVTFRLVLFI